MSNCTGCGYPVDEGAGRCPLCGTAIRKEKAIPVPIIPPAGSSAQHNPVQPPPVQHSAPGRSVPGSGPIGMSSLIAQMGGAASTPVGVSSLIAGMTGAGSKPIGVSDLAAGLHLSPEEEALSLGGEAALQTDAALPDLIFDDAKHLGGGVRVIGFNAPLPADVVIPRQYGGQPVTEIAASAFAGSGVVCVHIPDTVLSIGDSAFENCRALSSVTGCENLAMIGSRAFAGCLHLVNCDLPARPHAQLSSFAGCFDGGMELEAQVIFSDEDIV